MIFLIRKPTDSQSSWLSSAYVNSSYVGPDETTKCQSLWWLGEHPCSSGGSSTSESNLTVSVSRRIVARTMFASTGSHGVLWAKNCVCVLSIREVTRDFYNIDGLHNMPLIYILCPYMSLRTLLYPTHALWWWKKNFVHWQNFFFLSLYFDGLTKMKGKPNKTKEEVNQSVSQLTSHITVIHILSNAKLKHQLQSANTAVDKGWNSNSTHYSCYHCTYYTKAIRTDQAE